MGYIGDGPKPELEVGDISTKDVTATGDVTISDKIIHSGDTNTAIRFAAADTVTVETAGSERVRFDSSGQVGIGTTSPAEMLHVFHATANVNAIIESGDANAYLAFKDNATSGNAHVFLGASGDDMTFFSGGATERMRIDSSGNVGIGTDSPDTLLNLESAAPTMRLAPTTQNNSASIELGVLNGGTNAYAKIDSHNTTNYDSNIRFFTNAAGSTTQVERMRILSGGGLTFNGDTAQANALDDYEEGTWTPAITQGWTSVSYTNSYQYGRYTKVGNMVTAWFWLQFSGTSAGNQVFLGGLPFTTPDASNSELAHRGGAVTYFNVPVNAAGAITAYTAGGNTVIQFYAYDDGGASAVSNANASDAFLIGSVTYWVE